MKIIYHCIQLSILFVGLLSCQAQTIKDIKVIDLAASAHVIETGNLNNGTTIPLDWAQKSNVACFPGTRFREFQGNHVFYRIDIPPHSITTFTVSPKNSKDRINIYGIRLPQGNTSLPPEIARGVCESDYEIYAGQPNLNKANGPKSIEFTAIQHSYTIVIGIAGAKDVLEGKYTLEINTVK